MKRLFDLGLFIIDFGYFTTLVNNWFSYKVFNRGRCVFRPAKNRQRLQRIQFDKFRTMRLETPLAINLTKGNVSRQ